MDVSVIIPLYNAESTIEQAIKSISLSINYEIICVDDGSTDASKSKIKLLESNFPIKYFYQNNSGAASARNKGLSAATGEYIIFLDADDIYVEGAIEKMYWIAKKKKVDIVLGNVAHKKNQKITKINTYSELFSTNKVTTLEESPEILQSIGPAAKLYTKEIINYNFFDEKVKFCEEHSFNCNIYIYANFYIMKEIVYIYNKDNINSTVSQSQSNIFRYLNDACIVREKINTILKNELINIKSYYEYRMDKLIVFYLIKNNYMGIKDRKKILEEIIYYMRKSEIKSPEIKEDFKNLYLTIAASMSFKFFRNYSKKVNVKASLYKYSKFKVIHLIWKFKSIVKGKIS